MEWLLIRISLLVGFILGLIAMPLLGFIHKIF